MTVISLFKKRGTAAEETDVEVEETELVDETEAGEEAAEEETERQAAVRELREAVAQLTGRLWQGSLWLCQGCTRGLAAWCRNGRREDLEGSAAEYGVWGRGLVLLGLAVGGWKLATAAPVILAPAAGIWLLAAARAEPPEPEEEAPAEGAVEGEGEAPVEPPVVALVRAQIGDEKAVHLSTLYPAMRASLPGAEEAPDEALRKLLREHQIPVDRSVRVGGVAGRSGVYRKNLPPLPSKKVSQNGDSELSKGGDAGQGRGAESGGEARRGAGDGSERGGEATARLIQDPENPARWCIVAPPTT
ncbi:hypothetical protein [Streptomyces sp. NPDC059278]|uniref:hypothetical protein n=1 Tax=Streptomyces sp. NPDC059278 TaxID=3346801 RepID=UPI0036C95600